MSKGCLVCCFQLKFDFIQDDKIPGQGKKCVQFQKYVGLTEKDMNKMFHVFTVADNGVEDDHLDVDEFLKYAKVDPRFYDLGHLVFSLFAGGDMRLDFYEFIRSMFFFLTQSKTEMALFAFQLFDPDNSDSLTGDELKILANFINPGYTHTDFGVRYKRRTKEERINLGLSLLDLDGDSEISSAEFLTMIYNNTNLKIIEPFFHLQNRLRESSLGASRWKYLESYRSRVLYQVNKMTGEEHPSKLVMERCLQFSRRFALTKIFELNGMSESSYLSNYNAHHKDMSKSKQSHKSKIGYDDTKGQQNERAKQRRSSTHVKGGVSASDPHAHTDKIVKIQSRVRGVIGRQNSDKLRLERDMKKEGERTPGKGQVAESKPRRSSILSISSRSSARVGATTSSIVTSPDESGAGVDDNNDDAAVKIQKRIRGVIGRQNSDKMKMEMERERGEKRSKRRSSVM